MTYQIWVMKVVIPCRQVLQKFNQHSYSTSARPFCLFEFENWNLSAMVDILSAIEVKVSWDWEDERVIIVEWADIYGG